MEEKTCKECGLFLQHYGLCRSRLFILNCGHCTAGAPKHKRPDAKACDKYIPPTGDEEPFATKEYLSQRLMEYVLQMELFPGVLTEDPDSQ